MAVATCRTCKHYIFSKRKMAKMTNLVSHRCYHPDFETFLTKSLLDEPTDCLGFKSIGSWGSEDLEIIV